jgi:hypothetical protein
MHLDDERIQRLIAGEIWSESALRGHLAACPDCQEAVARAEQERREVETALEALDHPVPRVDMRRIVAGGESRSSSGFRWAAAILLTLGIAGVAYAAPGSPVRRWVDAAIEWFIGTEKPAPTAEPAPYEEALAGIAVVPGADLIIEFTHPQAVGEASISLVDSADVVVRALSGVATFTSDVNRLIVANPGSSANFEILIPHTAHRVEVLVAGRRVFLKEDGRITSATSADAAGNYQIPFSVEP